MKLDIYVYKDIDSKLVGDVLFKRSIDLDCVIFDISELYSWLYFLFGRSCIFNVFLKNA